MVNAEAKRGNDLQSDASRLIRDPSEKWLSGVSIVFISLFSLFCLFPFVLLIATSLTKETVVLQYGFNIWPRVFSVTAYDIIFKTPGYILGSYIVTVSVTAIGTTVGLFVVAMTGYALTRPDFPFRNNIMFYIYFTMLFQGGLVPYYLLMSKYFRMQGNYLAVLLPGLMSPWLIILMRNFAKSIPFSLTESAKVDGANDFYIFVRVVLPMLKPALATIGLFLALGYWNEWYNANLFLTNAPYQPLQMYMYNIVNKAQFLRDSSLLAGIPRQDMPTETLKMATAVVATGPIVLAYPFVQRYFIKGITIGAVKG